MRSTARDAYERNKERARAASRERSLAGRDVAPLPAIESFARRLEARESLLAFCRSYFAPKFKKPFGPIHLRLIDALQTTIVSGGKQAVAMPRGTGKTTTSLVAVVWALVNGYRRFVVVVAANTREARRIQKTLASMISQTPTLRRDYPEICVPFGKLNGSALLARGQTFYGEPTGVEISADSFRLPTIPGSVASGATVAAYGITGAIRGLQTENPDGSTDRPDFLLLDDLQTDAVAINPNRVAAVDDKVASTLQGLGENGGELSTVQTITVRAPDDYADRILNRELYPAWNGLRFASLDPMPERIDLWRQYRAIWFDDEAEATRFYRANLAEMRRGAVVGWPDAYQGKKLVDTLEYYMRLWCENERAFFSEQQNRPLELGGAAIRLPAKEIAKKINGYERGVVPNATAKITAFVDVHGDLLYWAVVAWRDDFAGCVVDYGTFPEQRRTYFAKNDGGLETLARLFPGSTVDGRVREGLEFLFRDLLGRSFPREDGETFVGIDRICVDVGWKPETVENAIRAVDPRFLVPTKGAAVGAKQKPMRDWPKRDGRVFGWRLIDEKTKGAAFRSILVDSNYWKTKVHEAASLEAGEPGSLSLWGTSRATHRMFSEHLAAEIAKPVECVGNRVVEWEPSPTRPDNHFFDCVVGCFVVASTLGLLTNDDPRRGAANGGR
ncbi:MAG: phage terminase large subunit family protein [Thermoguttaceae bacterium]|nr:phage terminase large subunit family protein [Thermoguttaceae bacterium]